MLVLHALTGDSHVVGPGRARAPDARLVGRPDRARARRWTPTAGSSSRRTCSAAARAHRARRRPRRTVGRGDRASRGSPSATRWRPRRRWPTSSASTRWAAVVGGSMGGMRALEWAVGVPGPGARRASLLATGAATPPRDQIAWARRRSRAIRADPHWRGGDYHDAAPGDGPHGARPSPAGSRTSPTGGDRSSTTRFGRGAAGRRGPARRRRPVRGRVLPRPPRRQARPPLRRRHLRRAHRGDELPRLGRGRGGVAAALGGCPHRRSWPRSTATGSTRSASRRSSPAASRTTAAGCGWSPRPTGTTGSCSRSTRCRRWSGGPGALRGLRSSGGELGAGVAARQDRLAGGEEQRPRRPRCR